MKWTIDEIRVICEEASAIILSYYQEDLEVVQKSDDTPVTAADKASDTYIRGQLKKLEDIPILSEESHDTLERLQANKIWLVDPLDGTKDFIAKTDEFAINIALIEKHRPIFGAIYLPVKREFYYAFQNHGAFFYKNGVTQKIEVSKRTHNLRLFKSRFYHSNRLDEIVNNYSDRIEGVYAAGSSYKACLIARGDGECYIRYGLTSEWDTAPMDILVHEAGGIVRQMKRPLKVRPKF